jgi:succinate-acetate transporter protein
MFVSNDKKKVCTIIRVIVCTVMAVFFNLKLIAFIFDVFFMFDWNLILFSMPKIIMNETLTKIGGLLGFLGSKPQVLTTTQM